MRILAECGQESADMMLVWHEAWLRFHSPSIRPILEWQGTFETNLRSFSSRTVMILDPCSVRDQVVRLGCVRDSTFLCCWIQRNCLQVAHCMWHPFLPAIRRLPCTYIPSSLMHHSLSAAPRPQPLRSNIAKRQAPTSETGPSNQ